MGLVADNVDETTSALGGDLSTDTSAALALAPSVSFTRSCTADTTEKTATVTITYSGSETKTKGSVTTVHSASGNETRVWSNPVSDTAVACGALGKYVKIDWTKVAEVNGLKLQVTTSRTNDLSTTFTRKGSSVTRTFNKSLSGTRTITWETPSGATDTTTVTKTAVIDVTHSSKLTKIDGTVVDLSSEHKTLENAPLVTTRVSDTSGNPMNFTVVSGTMSISKSSRFYVTNKYTNLVFDLTSDDPCTPSSGTILTSIYNTSSDSTPLKTYTITFSGGTGTVGGDSDASDNFNSNINHTCAFVEGS